MKWPKIVNMYWCPNCNVPVLSSTCPKCGSKTIQLKLPPPGDARLAFKHDILRINTLLERYFNTRIDKLFKGNNIVLLSKEPYIDERRVVIVSGVNIGSIYFNPYLYTDMFKPSPLLAHLLINNNITDPIKLNNDYKIGDLVRIENNRDVVIGITNSYVYVLMKVNEGLYRVKDKSPLNVLDRQLDKLTSIDKNNTLQTVVTVNEPFLLRYVSVSEAFIYSMHNKINKTIVSFSGGKDSLTVLHLTLDAGIEPEVVFNNTGIELPETIETVYNTIEEFDLKLHIADAGDRFWKAVKTFGPPARNYRWCCKVVKLVPFARLAKSTWKYNALNILGQRSYESYDRARSPRVWRNKWVPNVLSAAPIQDWPQFLVWLYIFKNKLDSLVNSLYFKGFERIGCYLCPASSLYEFSVVEKTHPELWEKWKKVLRSFGCSETCIKLGLWRWIGPASVKKQLMSKYRIAYSWEHEYSNIIPLKIKKVNISVKDKSIVYTLVFDKHISAHRFKKQASILRLKAKDEKVLENSKLRVEIQGNKLKLAINETKESLAFETMLDVLKILYRAQNCVGCGSCTLWCPTNAIRISNENYPVVDTKKCISCKICIHECPIAELIVDKLIASLILKRYDGWRREGRVESKKKIDNTIKLLAVIKSATYRDAKSEKPSSDTDYSNIIINFDRIDA